MTDILLLTESPFLVTIRFLIVLPLLFRYRRNHVSLIRNRFLFLAAAYAYGQVPCQVPEPCQVPILCEQNPPIAAKLSVEEKQRYYLESPDIITVKAIHWVSKDPQKFQEDEKHIFGNHTIGPDGYITLGSYGRVYVNGLTVEECKHAVEFHLSKHFEEPKVAVDIFAYNSKAYYVIFQSQTKDERTIKFPYTGNENVRDAIANAGSFQPNVFKRVWVARPVGNSSQEDVLPVDWEAITVHGKSDSNHQLMPGDRIYILEGNPPTMQRSRFLPRRERVKTTILR